MGLTRTDYFSKEQNDIAILMKALGHPARIAIIDYLLSVDSCICGDIVKELPLSQATVSQHLKELKTAGIIDGKVEASAMRYRINKKTINDIKDVIDEIFKKVKMQDLRSLYSRVK